MTTGWGFPDFDDHEGVHLFTDPASGLRAVIAVHSTALGPAAGGVRFWNYADSDGAITDALRLSRGMSYKNAMAGLPMGGGKGVVLADAARTKTPELLKAFGRAVELLGGRYVTAEDVGMTDDDMVTIGTTTRHVSGLPVEEGLAGGDPGPSTAMGVYLGVKAAAKRGLGADSMEGVHVAIQGVGSVGGGLARLLAKDGAKLTLADVNAGKAAVLAAELGADTVAADAILACRSRYRQPERAGRDPDRGNRSPRSRRPWSPAARTTSWRRAPRAPGCTRGASSMRPIMSSTPAASSMSASNIWGRATAPRSRRGSRASPTG